MLRALRSIFFFFNDTATTEIYTLSLHDALPIFQGPEFDQSGLLHRRGHKSRRVRRLERDTREVLEIVKGMMESSKMLARSEEHTSELQSPDHLVCRLLLEKKKRDKEK